MNLKRKNILVTGAAGFIGSAFVERLLEEEEVNIIGIDNINPYYNTLLKEKRIEILYQKES